MLEVVSGEELYVIKGHLYSAHFSTLREIDLLPCCPVVSLTCWLEKNGVETLRIFSCFSDFVIFFWTRGA